MAYTRKRKTHFKKTRKNRFKKKFYSKRNNRKYYGGKTKTPEELIAELTKLITSKKYVNKFDDDERKSIINKYTDIYKKRDNTWKTEQTWEDDQTQLEGNTEFIYRNISMETYQTMLPDSERDIEIEYENKQRENEEIDNSHQSILNENDYLLVSNKKNFMQNAVLFINDQNGHPLIFIGDYYKENNIIYIEKGIILKIKPNHFVSTIKLINSKNEENTNAKPAIRYIENFRTAARDNTVVMQTFLEYISLLETATTMN
jgi:adenosyl cobinamide kinase/adenosyl cobinamide phosphate guanylyltransferase